MEHFRYTKDVLQALENDRFYGNVDMAHKLCRNQAKRLGISEHLFNELQHDRSINGEHKVETYLNLFIDLVMIEKYGQVAFIESRSSYRNDIDDRINVDMLLAIFRDIKFPLPFTIFPGCSDNSESFTKYIWPKHLSYGPVKISTGEIQQAVDELNGACSDNTGNQINVHLVNESDSGTDKLIGVQLTPSDEQAISKNLPTGNTAKAGRKPISNDVDCRNIYDLKYRLVWSYNDIIEKYWPNSQLSKNTLNDRVKKAIVRGRKLTPPGQRPETDPNRS